MILPASTNAQVKVKTEKIKNRFYGSITVSGPVDHTTQIDGMLKLFDLPLFNNEATLKVFEKAGILKKQVIGNGYWFRVPLQEDFGKDAVCYMIYDSSLFWFGGFKLFAWSKDGKNKKEPEGIVWAEYTITPNVGYTLSNSNLLDNTGLTNIDMKDFYGNLDGANLSFDKRKKPVKPQKVK